MPLTRNLCRVVMWLGLLLNVGGLILTGEQYARVPGWVAAALIGGGIFTMVLAISLLGKLRRSQHPG